MIGQAWRSRMPEGLSRRAAAIVITVAIEAVLLIMLLTLGAIGQQERVEVPVLSAFEVREAPDASVQAEAEPDSGDQGEPAPQPPTPQAASPAPPALPSALPALAPARPDAPSASQPAPQPDPPAEPAPADRPRIRAVVRQGETMGPPDTGRPGPPDSEVVGTAPDGSPLYAARWYREPYASELDGYLSTARGPGWGLIVCRTAANWRVEDCEILGESPRGSGIARAAHAAAWQFQVRPPRVNGEYQVGTWVRIRINYATRPAR